MSESTKADYDYAREQYYTLVEKGQEAIEMMMELARESEHPRAFEVLSNMIKNTADVSDKLMQLNMDKKKLENISEKEQPAQITNNNVFVGSTTDLQRMLLNKKEQVKNINDDE